MAKLNGFENYLIVEGLNKSAMGDIEILLHGIMDELYIRDKMDVLEFIENILGELPQKRLDNILSNLIEERVSSDV